MGDFNLDFLKHELHRPTERFLDTMYANSYIPIINRPTRVTRNTCTLIDNIFTNNYSINNQLFNGISKADISDHYILFYIIKSTDSTKDVNSDYKTVRIVNESRINGFVEKIKNTDWSVLNSHRDCQTYFAKFYALFKTIYDGSFPLTRVKMRYRNRLPWLKKSIKNKINCTGFHSNIPHVITLQNTKIIKINFLPFWRNRKKCTINRKLSLTKLILEKCGELSNMSSIERKV